MMPIQIVLAVFFLFALLRVLGRGRAHHLSFSGTALWVLFWLAGIVFVLQPNTSSYFAKLVGVGRGSDLVVYVALALLFFMVFRLMVRQEKLSREITIAIRSAAVTEAEKKE